MKHSGKELDFCNFIHQKIIDGEKMNKRDTERFAADFGIFDKNAVKELCELAIVFRARKLANRSISSKVRYNDIVTLYRSQVNLSHRTSQSVMLQQYSTPAPIGFLAGLFVRKFRVPMRPEPIYFEPSAGNGLLTIILPEYKTTVNEIDEFRSKNLAVQEYAEQLRQDATEPFHMDKKFDGIITNPPFGKMDKSLIVDDFPINTLDHVMAIRALDCMKDDGRAAIIIGGHTEWDSAGRIKAGKNRIFFSYLYKHYHVADVINIDGDLYSRQGTSFDVRLILIDGRKETPNGYPPLKRANEKVVKDFDNLYDRVIDGSIDKKITENTVIDDKRIRIVKVKAAAKLKVLELLRISA
jgi:tRNA1(Val) A37 N6-methylase TrmN6